MKKILIVIVILILFSTTFVNVTNAKINFNNNSLLKLSNIYVLDRIIDFLMRISFINQTINFFKNLFGFSEADPSDEPDEEKGRTTSPKSDSIRDPSDDVMQYMYHDERYGWKLNIGDKPHIDIAEVSYSESGDKVTLSLKMEGTISRSEDIVYHAYLNTSDSQYWLTWINDEGIGMAMNLEQGSFEMDSDPKITTMGNTISATYNIIGSFSSDVQLWGWAAEYSEYGDTSAEWWGDWAPNDESPYYEHYTADPVNMDAANGTPGFEMITLIIAFAAIVFILKKKE
jgi:hypothetical protein